MTNGYGTSFQADSATLSYSDNGHPLTVKDANNNLTTTIYDGFDRASKIEYPLSAKGANASNPNDYEAYTYDANGNPLTVNRRPGGSGGATITLTYDALNRLTRKSFPTGTEQNVYYAYDLLNRALYAHYGSAGGAGMDYAYDALGRTTSTTASTTTPSRTLSYQYDLAGDRTRITWPDTGSNALYVAYAYDLLQRVTQVQENGATSGPGLLAAYTYDDLGRRTRVARAAGGGATTTLGYQYADWLNGLTHNFSGSGSDVEFTPSYSPAFQVTGQGVTNDAYTFHPGAISKSYTANGLNQYASVSGTSFAYDPRGNLTSDGTRRFTYDVENHLLTASAPTAVTLAYDPLGRLQTSTAAGATTNFLYDGDNLVGEYDGSGTILNRYVPGPGVDEPLVWYAGPGTATRRWYQADTEGSIVAWSDSTGAQVASRAYDPYGQPDHWLGSRFGYTGQIVIPEAKLYSYKARVYDPGLGRFLQTDPIGYQSDVNTYAYTGNNPRNRSDPSGLVDPTTVSEFVVTAPAPEENTAAAPQGNFEFVNATFYDSVGSSASADLGEIVVTGHRFGRRNFGNLTLATFTVSAASPQDTQAQNSKACAAARQLDAWAKSDANIAFGTAGAGAFGKSQAGALAIRAGKGLSGIAEVFGWTAFVESTASALINGYESGNYSEAIVNGAQKLLSAAAGVDGFAGEAAGQVFDKGVMRNAGLPSPCE